MRPSGILMAPFVLLALFCFYMAWNGQDNWAVGIIICVVMIAGVYVLSPQIDWFWYQKYPPRLDEDVKKLLERSPLVTQLSPGERVVFETRTALFMMAKDFKGQGIDSIPEDVKAVVAASAVLVTLHQEDYLFPNYETIILYKHPFPSPQYPNHFHSSEVFDEDGVLLFCIEHLMKSFLSPYEFYPIALHEWTQVYVKTHPDKSWPNPPDNVWEKLGYISGFTRDWLQQWVNRPDLELLPAVIVHWFLFPHLFPQAQSVDEVWQQDEEGMYPVLEEG